METSAIRGVQVKCDEPYFLYGEEHFAQDNKEVCRLRKLSLIVLLKQHLLYYIRSRANVLALEVKLGNQCFVRCLIFPLKVFEV